MPTHYKGKTGAARKKALKEHKASGRKKKQFGGGFNQPLAGARAPMRPGVGAPMRPLGLKHGKSAKKK